MSLVHFHLILNHIPVLGTIGALLLLVAALVVKSADLRRAAYVAFAVVALCTIPVYFTGEPAEDAVENLPGVSKAIIEQHEEGALFAFVGIAVTGALALVALFMEKATPARWRAASTVVVLAAALSAVVIARVANLGGEVRHSEIRSGSAASVPAADHDD